MPVIWQGNSSLPEGVYCSTYGETSPVHLRGFSTYISSIWRPKTRCGLVTWVGLQVCVLGTWLKASQEVTRHHGNTALSLITKTKKLICCYRLVSRKNTVCVQACGNKISRNNTLAIGVWNYGCIT
jgi:hypothetical protein